MPDNEIDTKNIYSYDYACSWLFGLSYEIVALEEAVEATTLLSEDRTRQVRHKSDPIFISYNIDTLHAKLIDSAGKLAQLMGYFFQVEQGIIGRSLAIWPLEACWNALDNEWARLQTGSTELSLDDGDDVAFTETDRRRAAIQKYLRLCRNAAANAKSYGLPLMKERG